MKLTYFQLEAHLNKKLAPFYVVSGEEVFLKQEAIQLIRKAAKKEAYLERIRLTPETGFNWDQLYLHLYSQSLMAEKRLIELDLRDTAPPKGAAQILQEYSQAPSPHQIVLIETGKLEDKIKHSAWYKTMDTQGVILPIWPIARDQLPKWLMNRAQKYKLLFKPDAVKLLAEFVEGNLVAAAQAIEKIYLQKPEQAVDVELVKAVLTDESHFNTFDFIEHWIAGETSKTLHILDTLQKEGAEPILILWAMSRELRLLAEFAQKRDQGEPLDSLYQKHRIFGPRQAAIRRFLTRFSLHDCWRLLNDMTHLDQIIKGAVKGSIWENLQLFCLRMV